MNADVIRHLYDRLPCGNEFISSLVRQFEERGTLSERQLAAVRAGIEREAIRARTASVALAASAPAGTGLDLIGVPEGRYAVPGGDTRLKVLVQRPEPPSKWAGWIFVSDAAVYGQRKKYGRQPPGKTYSGEIVEALRVIAQDPRAACAAYGRLTNTCGVCGRALEDEESVARGIGPICAGRF